MGQTRCINCMELIEDGSTSCPHCGYQQEGEISPFGIKPKTILKGRYLVGRILGQGGFGITYVGYDLTLECKVAIKEYFPMGCATRDYTVSNQIQWSTAQLDREQWQQGSENFLKEARRMAKLDLLPGIVRVKDTFPENQTSYIVMDYVEGETLKQKLLKNGVMEMHECLTLLMPLLQSLEKMHQKGLVHRDISPDNIMIGPDGSAWLLDFGAAKDVSMQQNAASQQVAKKGFSPPEQYRDKGSIGPWTDVYALCATIYYCITGKTIPDAMDRMYEDTLTFDVPLKEPLSESQKNALKEGLVLRSENRIQSMERLIGCLSGTAEAVRSVLPQPANEVRSVPPEPEKADTAPVFQTSADEAVKTPDESGGKPKKKKKKKKMIIVAAVVVAVLVFFYIIGSSGTKRFGDYRYEITSNDNIKITDYKGTGEEIEIPSEIKSKPVTEIDSFTFSYCRSLQKVAIPDGVTKIGGYTFSGCSSLTEVTIPDSVTKIGRYTFKSCNNLTEIMIPDGVSEIDEKTFTGCTNLKVISLPAGCKLASDAVDDNFGGRIIYRDASGYIKAMLDVACKNDSADYVAQNIGTAEEASAVYQEMVSGDIFSDSLDGLTDEQKERMTDAVFTMFSKVDYTVGEAQKQQDGTYLVPVTYRQMKVFSTYMETVEQGTYAILEKYSADTMSEEDFMAEVTELVVQCFVDAVDHADYSDETAVKTVRVKATGDGGFEANATDIEELVMLFFDYDALGEKKGE